MEVSSEGTRGASEGPLSEDGTPAVKKPQKAAASEDRAPLRKAETESRESIKASLWIRMPLRDLADSTLDWLCFVRFGVECSCHSPRPQPRTRKRERGLT